jgi:hypothetical protein
MLLEPATAPLKRRHFRSCQFSRVQPAYICASPAAWAMQIGPTALSVSPMEKVIVLLTPNQRLGQRRVLESRTVLCARSTRRL